jgi:hypothetical protein
VPQQHVLDVAEHQWPLQQRIAAEENLPDRQIAGGAPIRIHPPQQVGRERGGFHGSGFLHESKIEDAGSGTRDHQDIIAAGALH